MGRHAAIDMPWADGFYTFRLGLEQIEELEEKRDASLFALYRRLSPEVRDARLADIREVLRIGLIGGDMKPVDAMLLVRRYIDERPIDENRDAAYAVVLAGLSRVHTEIPPKGEDQAARPPGSTSPPSGEPPSTSVATTSCASPLESGQPSSRNGTGRTPKRRNRQASKSSKPRS